MVVDVINCRITIVKPRTNLTLINMASANSEFNHNDDDRRHVELLRMKDSWVFLMLKMLISLFALVVKKQDLLPRWAVEV